MILFSRITPYFTDPLILFGLLVTGGLLLVRYLIKSKKINRLPGQFNAEIPQLAISHGYVLGILIVFLGGYLKHNEVRKGEQLNAMSQLAVEYNQNITAIRQLSENTKAQLKAREMISAALRSDGSKILRIMFPVDVRPDDAEVNITKVVDASFDQLQRERLFNSKPDMAAYNAVKDKIRPAVNQHLLDLRSIQDKDGQEYMIRDRIWHGHKEIFARMDDFDVAEYEDVILEMEELRSQYDLVFNHAESFMAETKKFMDRNTFIGNGDVYEILTKERLALKSLQDFDTEITGKAKSMVQMKQTIQSFLN